MLELAIGVKSKPAAVNSLIESFKAIDDLDGALYVGYPILAVEQESAILDSLLTSPRHGVVVFTVLDEAPSSEAEWEAIAERENATVLGLIAKLVRFPQLAKRRQLAFPVQSVIYYAFPLTPPEDLGLVVAHRGNLHEVLAEFIPVDKDLVDIVDSVVQQATNLKPPKKRASVSRTNSRGGILKEIEKEIARLDRYQKKAAIETPEGAQRIRGLAGSGKTITLALKAAYLHFTHPEWRIAVTFHTRSLYQQLTDLVRRFSYEISGDEPDWSRLRIVHAWGGSSPLSGMYSEIASAHGFIPKDWTYAKSKYGSNKAFDGLCAELLPKAEANPVELYDAILIDEAQDLPPSFFRLVHFALKAPKRIVWAYDELQNLGSYTMLPPSELFGRDSQGRALVQLPPSEAGQPSHDIILPICYRNSPWALVSAHAFGFGVYRNGGLIQYFDDPRLWLDIGYWVEDGEFSPGETAMLARREDCTPKFFADYLLPEDAVQLLHFATEDEQARWVAEQIRKNLFEDELDPSDILVIFANAAKLNADATLLVDALDNHGIRCHIAGVSSNRDQFSSENSITISSIYRAKGNEAPMVYFMNAEYCSSGSELIKRRNILFTAITRSRGWVRVCGTGSEMGILTKEFTEAVKYGYRLFFSVPTPEVIANLRNIHRDMSEEEMRLYKDSYERLRLMAEKIEKGELEAQHYRDVIERLHKSINNPDA